MTYTIITRSSPPCAYCDKAKALLDSKGIAYTEYDLSANEGSIELFKILGYKTIPVITDGDRVIGGYDELFDQIGHEEWIEHKGPLPPLNMNIFVDFKTANMNGFHHQVGSLDWGMNGDDDRITHYRKSARHVK